MYDRGVWIAGALVVVCACGRIGFAPDDTASDAALSDASTPDATQVACEDLPGILFCDSFENVTKLGTAETTAPGFVRIDGERVFRGETSLHARTTQAPEASWAIGGVLPSIESGELYARWYLYFPSSNPARSIATIHLIGSITPFFGVIFGATEGAIDVSASKDDALDISDVPMPLDRWFCVQLRMTIGSSATVETWVDGTPAARLDNVDTQPMGGIANVHAGLFTAVVGGINDLWTDELAIGAQPIDCL